MKTLTIEFSDDEWAKLQQLATFRRMSVAECLRAFARFCQPGGSGWKHPSETKVHESVKMPSAKQAPTETPQLPGSSRLKDEEHSTLAECSEGSNPLTGGGVVGVHRRHLNGTGGRTHDSTADEPRRNDRRVRRT